MERETVLDIRTEQMLRFHLGPFLDRIGYQNNSIFLNLLSPRQTSMLQEKALKNIHLLDKIGNSFFLSFLDDTWLSCIQIHRSELSNRMNVWPSIHYCPVPAYLRCGYSGALGLPNEGPRCGRRPLHSPIWNRQFHEKQPSGSGSKKAKMTH